MTPRVNVRSVCAEVRYIFRIVSRGSSPLDGIVGYQPAMHAERNSICARLTPLSPLRSLNACIEQPDPPKEILRFTLGPKAIHLIFKRKEGTNIESKVSK